MTGAADANGRSPDDKAAPVDWNDHFGEEGRARQLASLRVLLSAFTGVPGIIGLHGGLPPADAFPFTDMSFTLRDGTKKHISDPAQVLNFAAALHTLRYAALERMLIAAITRLSDMLETCCKLCCTMNPFSGS